MRRNLKNGYGEVEILSLIGSRQVQDAAKRRIGRKLADYQLDIVAEHLEEGLSFGIEEIFTAAIEIALAKTGAKVKWRHPYEHKNRR